MYTGWNVSIGVGCVYGVECVYWSRMCIRGGMCIWERDV